MKPILFAFQVPYLDWLVQVQAYPLAQLLALALFLALTLRLYARDVGPPGAALDVLVFTVPAALVGARLLGGALADDLPDHVVAMQAWWSGTKASYGGVIAGGATALLVARWRGVPIARFLDAAAPGLLLGVACCRIGCFLAGCCFGRPTESAWGVRFPHAHAGMLALPPGETWGLHPTQLYAAAAAVGIALVLLVLRRLGVRKPGVRALLGAALGAVAVFAIDFLRAEAREVLGRLSMSQWISVGMLLAVAFAVAVGRLRPVGAGGALRATTALVLFCSLGVAAQPTPARASDPPGVSSRANHAQLAQLAMTMVREGRAGVQVFEQLATVVGAGQLATWAGLALGADTLLAGNPEQAAAEWRAAAQVDPGTPWGAEADLAHAFGLLVLGDHAQALAAFGDAAASGEPPVVAVAEVSRGRLLAAAGDDRGAEAAFRRVYEGQPRSLLADDAALGLARALARQGRTSEARAVIGEARQRFERRGKYLEGRHDRRLRWDRLSGADPAALAAALRAEATRALAGGRSPVQAVLAAATDRSTVRDMRRMDARLRRGAPPADVRRQPEGIVRAGSRRTRSEPALVPPPLGAAAEAAGARHRPGRLSLAFLLAAALAALVLWAVRRSRVAESRARWRPAVGPLTR